MSKASRRSSAEVPADAVVNVAAEGDVSLETSTAFSTVSLILNALRRRRRLLGATALAGVLSALALSAAFPPHYTATTLLLLQHPAQGDTAKAMETDAQLLETKTVAQATIDRTHLRLSPRQLVADSKVTVLTSDLLKLTVTGSSGAQAVERAGALAETFLAFRRDEYERQSRVEVDALRVRAAEVSTQLTKMTDAINTFASRPDASSGSGLRDYGDLLSQKATLSGQLDLLQQRIDSATVAPASSVEKSRVLDPASEDPRSPLRAMVINAVSGLIAGFAVAGTWVVLQEIASDNLRRSDDIATALRAPVAVTIRRLRGSPREQRRRFRKQGSHPRPDVFHLVQKWRDVLLSGASVRPALVVVSVGADSQAAFLIACTAAELVREGRSALVADFSDHSVLADIFAVEPQGTTTVARSGGALQVMFPYMKRRSGPRTDGVLETNRAMADADLLLVLVSSKTLMEPARLQLEWGTSAVAVVRAGAASANTLKSTAQLLRSAGFELNHLVVVGADMGDEGGVSGTGPAWETSSPPAVRARRVPSGDPG